jgi:hypothetical protein
MAVTAEIAITQIIGKEDDDIGWNRVLTPGETIAAQQCHSRRTRGDQAQKTPAAGEGQGALFLIHESVLQSL